jgi:hypothetical protein
VPELNAQCDLQQTEFKWGLYNKSQDMPSAVLLFWHFEYYNVSQVYLIFGAKGLKLPFPSNIVKSHLKFKHRKNEVDSSTCILNILDGDLNAALWL